jgi:antitoxin (DNA-binding transcriptional repressor) of toxin-antitoxin stability system
MKTVMLEELASQLPQVCDEVARTESAVMVSKQGQPFVVIAPAVCAPTSTASGASVWEAVAEWDREHPNAVECYVEANDLPPRWDVDRDPLTDYWRE